MLEVVIPVIGVVLAFGLIVLIHEFGHFVAARMVGVRVEVFSFGFGPHLSRKWRKTEYRLSLVPLGGYVKLAGEQREEGREPKEDEFFGKKVWQRAFVLAAGAAMNLALGLVAFIVAFGVGVPLTPAVAGAILPGNEAWKAGMRRGDKIVAINDQSGHIDFEDFKMAVALADPGKGLRIDAERDGRLLHFELHPRYEESLGLMTVGVTVPVTMKIGGYVTFDKGTSIESLPASLAGLKPGDEITHVNGNPVNIWTELEDAVEKSGGRLIRLTFRRYDEQLKEMVERQVLVKPGRIGRPLLGVRCSSSKVAAVRRRTWAARAGIREDDVITEVALPGGKPQPIQSASQFAKAIGDAEEFALTLEDQIGPIHVTRTKDELKQEIREFVLFEQRTMIDHVVPDFPAERAGLKPGDRLLRVNDEPITRQSDLRKFVDGAEGEPLHVEWEDPSGNQRDAYIIPQRQWRIGIVAQPLREPRELGLFPACVVGTRKALLWSVRFFLTIKKFFTRQVATRHLGGPILIVKTTYHMAKSGFGILCYWMGLISINLALLNLLPIPLLDGGHLCFCLVEKIKGSPVSERVHSVAAYIGLGLILLLLFYATWNDLTRHW